MNLWTALRFEWPWMMVVAVTPLLVSLFFRSEETPASAGLKLPFSIPAAPGAAGTGDQEKSRSGWLEWLIWILLALALTRPQWSDPSPSAPANGRDYLLLIDLSASMGAVDLTSPQGNKLTRAEAAARIASDWVRHRTGDRIGLIVFGKQAYLHTPLTFDRQAVTESLQRLPIGLAGNETAIGDALALAVNTLRQQTGTRVVWLITDGANTGGALTVNQGAWLAQREGVKVHSLGIGAAIDSEALGQLSAQTGGYFGQATRRDDLDTFVRRLDKDEPVRQPPPPAAVPRELFFWPLALALTLAAGGPLFAWCRNRFRHV